jgi:hypothetical protein
MCDEFIPITNSRFRAWAMPNKPLASSETSDSENGTAASDIEPGLVSIAKVE